MGELPEGGEGLFAKLQVSVPTGTQIVVLEQGQALDLGEFGVLRLTAVHPAPTDEEIVPLDTTRRAVVELELAPA